MSEQQQQADDQTRYSLDELQSMTVAAGMGQTWAQEDINAGSVEPSNVMQRASDRIQEYQQARSDTGATRLTAIEQMAIVDAYRQMAGLQPEGYYLTNTGAAVPRDKFAEIRRQRTEDDSWENFKANISNTVLQNLAGIRASQARITDVLGITDDAMIRAAQDSEEVTRILQPRGGKSGFAGQTVGNMMNLFLGRAGGLATKVGAPTMFAVSTAGYTFIDVARRREAGQKISPYTEWTAAISNAAIEFALESFGQAVANRAGVKLAGRIGELRGALTRGGMHGGIRTAASILVKHGFEQANMALEGAAEEGITEMLQNTVRRLAYAKEQAIFGGVGEAALQGAIMPLLASGPMAAIQYGGRDGKANLPPIPPSSDVGTRTLLDSMDFITEARPEKAPTKPEAKAPTEVKPKIPQTFRKFVESKGVEWSKMDGPGRDLDLIKQMRQEFDNQLPETVDVGEALQSEQSLPDNLKMSLPAEADIPDTRTPSDVSVADLTDKWIGDRQTATHIASIDARNHRDNIKGLLKEGESSVDVEYAMHIYVQMKNTPDAFAVENIQKLDSEERAAVERALSLSPEQQAYTERMIAENTALGIEAMEAGILKNYNENYSAIFWKKGDYSGKGRARFSIATPRQRQRTLPSVMEGWSRSLKLEVTSIVEAQMFAKQQIAQVIHDRNLVTIGLKSGVLSKSRDAEHTHRVKHPNFTKWLPGGKVEKGFVLDAVGQPLREARLQVWDPNSFVTPDGIIMNRTDMWADKKLASYLNNALGSSELFNIKGVGEILKYNQVLKHAVLTMSGFHYGAFLRSYMLASRGLNPWTGYFDGKALVLGKVPTMTALVRGGLTLGDQMGLDLAAEHEITRLGKMIDKVPMASGIRKSLIALSRANSNFLFNNFGTYLKANAAHLDYTYQLKKYADQIRDGKTTEHEIAKRIAKLYNDDFGGLNLQRMGRNPTLQAIHRALSLAPDWTESNVRTMVKAFEGGEEGSVYRGMWGRVLMKGVGATILVNFMTAAVDDEETFLSQYKKAWDAGNLKWMDVDITSIYRMFGGQTPGRKYASILGHLRDPIKFIAYPPRSAKGKMSMLARMAWEMGSGQDWRGRTFTTFGELAKSGEASKFKPFGARPIGWEQVPSYIIKQAEQSTPVAVQALINRMRGEIDTFDAITRSVGLPTVTTKPPKRKRRARRTRRKRRD